MRIAYLSTFYPFRGGIAQFNASLFREFEKEHEIKAFTFSRQYPEILFPGKTQFVTADETADEIPAERLLDSINPISWLKTAHAIKNFNPDLVLMKYWMSFFGPSLGTVAKFLPKHIKVITVLDNVIPHEKRFFDLAFTNYFLRQNNGFVAMSDVVQNDLLSLKPKAKFIKSEHPLYNHFGNKIDKKQAQAKLKLHPDKKTLLFFGFIRDYKGLDVLIDAFGTLDSSYQLVIAGETYGSFNKYQDQISQLKNKENVYVFNNYITDKQVPDFFSASDVCVLPYKSATQSGITSIAYHFDVPLIATDVGGLKESIRHMQTGLIAPDCSIESIRMQIEKFYSENLELHFKENIEKLKKELSWEKFAKSIITFSATL